MPTSFFNLPRELRDHIYHFAWQEHTMIMFHPTSFILNAIYPCASSHARRSTTVLPAWLLTNKATPQEGLEQFQRKGFLHHSSWFPGPTIMVGEFEFDPQILTPDGSATYDSTAFMPLLSPLNVRELRLELSHMNNDPEEAQAGEPWHVHHEMMRDDLEYTTSLMRDAAANDVLRVLKVSFGFETYMTNNHTTDLHDLQSIIAPVASKLTHFELRVSFPTDMQLAWDSLERSLMVEVTILSMWTLADMKCNVTDDKMDARWEDKSEGNGGWLVSWTRA
jgi:hypothetical protein